MDWQLDSRLATAAINLVTGLAITSLITSVAASAQRNSPTLQ
jgi:hypothetical protein